MREVPNAEFTSRVSLCDGGRALDLMVSGIHVDPKNFMRTAAQLLKLEAEDRSA